MGDYSFFNCSNLTTVQYAGSVEEWQDLVSAGRIGTNTFANTNVTKIVCKGGVEPVDLTFTAPVIPNP